VLPARWPKKSFSEIRGKMRVPATRSPAESRQRIEPPSHGGVGKQQKRRLKIIRRKSLLETQADQARRSNALQKLGIVLTMNARPFEIFDFEKNNQKSSAVKKTCV
jgi:hypothetical protein